MVEIRQVVVHFGEDCDEFHIFKKYTEIMLGKKVNLLNSAGGYGFGNGEPCWQEWNLEEITFQEFSEHTRKFNEFMDFILNGK